MKIKLTVCGVEREADVTPFSMTDKLYFSNDGELSLNPTFPSLKIYLPDPDELLNAIQKQMIIDPPPESVKYIQIGCDLRNNYLYIELDHYDFCEYFCDGENNRISDLEPAVTAVFKPVVDWFDKHFTS